VLDVLIVGGGPTGLALATQLLGSGVRFRIVDRAPDRVHESRALVIQPRTLEVLGDLAGPLVAAGNPAVHVHLHSRHRTADATLYDVGLDDSPYPFLLFLSQAETERILAAHLAAGGVPVERGVEYRDGTLVHGDGRREPVSTRYVVGCDGARSTVREAAGIPFTGRAYPHTFVLADLEVDGLTPGAAHVFLSARGLLLFFPLGTPASWRLLAMRQRSDPTPAGAPVELADLERLVEAYASVPLGLHEPVWSTNFRLANRGAARYRAGDAFVAGDAAHVHSPAGGQGMNIGIQDAVNLGWKLRLVCTAIGDPALLDTYDIERRPVGRAVLRLTDRVFTVGTSTNPVMRFARARIVPYVAPLALRAPVGRGTANRMLAELSVHYRRSPLSVGRGAGARVPPSRMDSAAEFRVPGFRLLPDGGLVRPDGYLAYRGDATGLRSYVDRWFPGAPIG